MVETPVLASSFADVAHTAADVTTVVAALVLAAWGYVRSYGQQITRPAIELTVDAVVIGEVASRSLLHVTLSVRNAGSRECRVFLYWKLSILDASLPSLTHLKYRNRTLVGQVKFAREVPMHQTAGQTGDDQQQQTAGQTGDDQQQQTAGQTGDDQQQQTAGQTGDDQQQQTAGQTGDDQQQQTAGQTGDDQQQQTAGQTGDDQQQQQTTVRTGSKARDAQRRVRKFGEAPRNFEKVLHGETFVSPGVTQRYDFVTSVPVGSAAALIIAQIQYERTRLRSEKVLGGPVRAVAGLSPGETTLTTFNHTTAEYVAIAPGSHPAGGNPLAFGYESLLRDGGVAIGWPSRRVAGGGGRVRAVRLLFRLRFVMLTRAGGALGLLFAVSRFAAAGLRCPGMPGSRRCGAGPGWRVAGQAAGGAFGCADGAAAGSGSRCSRVAAGTACLLLRVLTFLMV